MSRLILRPSSLQFRSSPLSLSSSFISRRQLNTNPPSSPPPKRHSIASSLNPQSSSSPSSPSQPKRQPLPSSSPSSSSSNKGSNTEDGPRPNFFSNPFTKSEKTDLSGRSWPKFWRSQLSGLSAVAFVGAGIVVWKLMTDPEGLEQTMVENKKYQKGVFHETRYRQPTKSDSSAVRHDVWKLVTPSYANEILRAAQKSTIISRPGNPVTRFDTSQIAANGPIEDREGDGVVRGPEGDLCFFAVFDGHSGPQTAHLLSQTLIPTAALSLSSLFSGTPPALTPSDPTANPFSASVPTSSSSSSTSSASNLQNWRRWLLDEGFGSDSSSSKEGAAAATGRDLSGDVDMVRRTIQSAFETLDASIVWDPVNLLATAPKSPDATFRSSIGLPTLSPALAGACALLAYLDCAHDDLYVALSGDCRAVAGIWDSNRRKWRVEVLSEDQTGRNPKELARMQASHPPNERNDVIRNGRVLGGLEPSRAFGDARYKWPLGVQDQLIERLLPLSHKRPRPPNGSYKTPPYVTAKPEVTHRKVSFNQNEGEELRFVVLATDGLYDSLSNESIVALVGYALTNPTCSGTVPKTEVLSHLSLDDLSSSGGIDGKAGKELKKDSEGKEGTFVFGKDTNYSTLLIRNSLAGGDELKMRQLLSVEPPISRYQRDDTTAKIIFFGKTPDELVESSPKAFWQRLWS